MCRSCSGRRHWSVCERAPGLLCFACVAHELMHHCILCRQRVSDKAGALKTRLRCVHPGAWAQRADATAREQPRESSLDHLARARTSVTLQRLHSAFPSQPGLFGLLELNMDLRRLREASWPCSERTQQPRGRRRLRRTTGEASGRK